MCLWPNEKLSHPAAEALEVVEEDHEAEDHSKEEEVEEVVVQADLVDRETGDVPTLNATTTISHGAQHVTGVKHQNRKDSTTVRMIADRAEDMKGEVQVVEEEVADR